MENQGYADYYVAFMDILGTKEFIVKPKNFQKAYGVYSTILNYQPHSERFSFDYTNIKKYVMSDSVVMFVKCSIPDSFIALTEICAQIQADLANRETPILLRGAIAKGELYHNDCILFGKGFVDAYTMENKCAVYPRIIFTSKLREEASNNTHAMYAHDRAKTFYNIDEDEFCFIDYLNVERLSNYTKNDKAEMEKSYFITLLDYCTEQLAFQTDKSIRDKYLWLKKWIVKTIEFKPEIKNILDERKQEESKLATRKIAEELFRGFPNSEVNNNE